MSRLPKDLPDCMVFLLGKAYQKAHAEFNKRLKSYGLTNMQHLVLEGLWYREGVTASDLGKLLILDKATLSGVLDRLHESGWIVKREDPADKRISRLYPSEKADGLKTRLIAERKQANKTLLARLSSDEQAILGRVLRKLI